MRLSGTLARSISTSRGLGNPLWDLAGSRPSLDLRFAESKSLVDATTGSSLVTFTRSSGATYVDSDGLNKTATTNEPRFDHDPTTGECLGLLLEEQRQNLLLNSNTLATQFVTVTAVTHALSFTGTGTITLSNASTAGPLVGTGIGEANRVSLIFTPTAGTLTLTVSGPVNNAQLEIGSFRTSYIPTTTSAVTRAADVASISGSDYSGWANNSAGTIFSDSTIYASSTQTQGVWQLRGGSALTSLRQPHFSANQFRAVIGGTFTPSPGTGAILTAGTTKAAVAYSGGLGRLQVGSEGVNASGNNLDSNLLDIGSLDGGSTLNGRLRRLTFWPQRLPDEIIQAITQ